MDIMDTRVLFSAIAVFTALSFIYALWHFVLAHFITLIHEIGHAITGVAGGGYLRRIKINLDASGETRSLTRGGIFMLGSFISSLSGYPAPFILGLIIVRMVEAEKADIVSWILLTIGIITLLFIRNWFGLLITLIWLSLTVLFCFFVMPDVRVVYLTILSALLIVGGIKDIIGLTRMYIGKRAEGTDISIVKESYGIPMVISLFLMYIMTISSFYFLIILK